MMKVAGSSYCKAYGAYKAYRAWSLAGAILLAAAAGPCHAQGGALVDFGGQALSAEAQRVARMAYEAGDARGRAFAVVDKKEARLHVFAADGHLAGSTPVLLGLARGDTSAPGVGRKVSTGIPAGERTTPAGRFDSEPGHNLAGEAIVWFDYEAALAIHRLRPGAPGERRAERLASATPDDNRISLGCVVVSGDFFDRVVQPQLGRGRAVVYVLPELAAPPDRAVALNGADGRL